MTNRFATLGDVEYEYTKLNKLKKTNPEAFFYLYKGLQMTLK